MRKLTLLICLAPVLAWSTPITPIRQGTTILSGSAALEFGGGQTDIYGGLEPYLFLNEYVAVGGGLGLSWWTNDYATGHNESFSLGGRIYVPLGQVYLFGGGGVGFALWSSESDYLVHVENSGSNWVLYGLGGLSLFLTESIALEPYGKLRFVEDNGWTAYMTLGVGFTMFFNVAKMQGD